jgi:putative restriction endonuclease
MEQYTIITENDESKWDDITGSQYHFPSRYLPFLSEGTKVVYYKGRLKDPKYRSKRLDDSPHYFGIAEVKSLKKDETTNSYFATIAHFSLFKKSVPFKINDSPLETIPSNKATNYWRDGVRPINKAVYTKILQSAKLDKEDVLNDQKENDLTSTEYDGGRKKIYTTVYERNRKLRDEAIRIHGYDCKACGFNYKKIYGERGEGYIHVHHIKPLSSLNERVKVNAEKDLVVVCANCHAMIHRRRDKVLTIAELKVEWLKPFHMTLKVR